MQVGVPQYTAQPMPTNTPVISPQVQALIRARQQQVGAAGGQPVVNAGPQPMQPPGTQPISPQVSLPPNQQSAPPGLQQQGTLSTAQQAILNYIQQHGMGTQNIDAIQQQQNANNNLSQSFAAPPTPGTQVPVQQVPGQQVPGQVNGGIRTTQVNPPPSPGVAQPAMQPLATQQGTGLSQGGMNGLARYYMR